MSKYRCPYCKHLEIDYDATDFLGETHLSEQWFCYETDDERPVVDCRRFEPKEDGDD